MNDQIDMLALAAEEKVVTQGLRMLNTMYSGQSHNEFYWQALLTFSYRYFKLGAVAEGVKVLADIPPAYFRGELVKQMEGDPLLAELAQRVADKLLEGKHVTPPSYDVDISKVNVQPGYGKA